LFKTLDCLDFIGVNHYFTHWVKGFSTNNDPEGIARNDLSWTLYPKGFYSVLINLKKFNKPILVTENGIPDGRDLKRSWFITAYLREVHRAIEDGAPVFGYVHWSLIDNWNGGMGFSGRFGLAETNFITFERKLRDSGALYGEIAKNNALPNIIPEQPQ
jgi:beta-glucosidase/6-phospho-beta-glucosidase/beta-galactosidase